MLLLYVCILALFSAAHSKESNDPKECKNYRLGSLGFTARFYSYELGSTMGWGRNFFKDRYRTSLIATASGIRNINFNFPKKRHMDVSYNILYGYKLTASNFTVELSGFFSVPQSGTYKFNLAADDGASLNVGAGENCCSDAARSVDKFPDIKPISPKAGKGSISTNIEKRDYTLKSGLYYPIKIVVFNWNGAGALDFFVTDPNKRTVRNFGSLVRKLKFKDSVCYATVTSVWNQPHSITTTQVSKPNIDTLTVYVRVPKRTTKVTRFGAKGVIITRIQSGPLTDTEVVEIPKPEEVTQVAWLKDSTSTSTDISPKLFNRVYVFVPKHFISTTKTWEQPRTSKVTEVGILTDHVVINVPTPTRHVTVAWKKDFTSTETVYGGPGETNSVIVKVPKVIVKNVKTWTGASILESTEHGDLTDHVVINVPTPTRHVTVAWKEDFTSTETVYGGPGETNSVIVKVPKVIVKNVKTWTGASILESTEHGDLTDHVVINVPTPTRHVTVAWKKDFTSTETVYGGPGETNSVIVKVPKVIVKNVKTWTGASILESTEHGDLTDHVVINVPTPTRHVTVAWKKDFTSTETVYGGPGETNSVIVKVPKVIVKNVKTWTGASILESTEHGDLTDHVVINVPTPTRHVTVAWKEDFTSTETVYGGPGETNSVIVKVPKVIVKNVKTWTGASILESTEHGDLTDHVVINVPTPTRHVTVAWKEDFTSTETVYGGPGETNSVIVKVPKVIVKNVKTWTGASILESTEHGDLTDHVVINVPTPTRHVTVAWKKDFTSTETVYGGPGETNSVIVKVPKVIVKNVKTWTGASILESTEHGDLTDHVVINVPTPTRHVTVAWKEDFTSTETVYGGPGETNSVIVKVPKVIVKNVKTWTGASILESTEHGDLTDHVVINVPTPTRHVTVAWKKDFTSTETVYGGPGETNSVIVKVPKVIVKNVKTWTGASILESTEHGDLTDHVVINVPTPTRHVTVAWKEDFTSTETVYGGPGETNSVIVKVPKVIVKNVKTWTGASILESTEHGDLTDHVVINVPTPTRHVTVAWKKDFTSTETVYGGPGETNSVIVKVPKVIVKNVKTWTGASILESTEHGDLTDHVVINVPTPTRHVTVAWKEDFTSTETVYGGPGETNSVIVKVPKVIVKNVNTWTGASILESTEHGDLTDHVVINVPTPTRHVTVAWKEDFTSTETVYGGPGETNSVIVKVPKVIVKNVKTWTGASILESTEHGDLTDHVVINVPTPTRHVTVAWKEDFTSTETVYGGPGETNSVIVKVPKVIVKNVKTWTGASILESTEHGDLTDHVVINVPTPTRHVTVAWKEDFTSTETVYGGPGETNSVIVKVPKVIVKNVKTWTGASILESTEHGDLTDHVVINVPTPTRHVTVAWKKDFTSTETVYGGPGETNSVIVKVPKVIVKNVKTWTGASILESTEHGDLTDHVVINVPTPTRHVTVAWKEDFTSTETVYGGPGETNSVIVKVPKVIVKNVNTWTGASILESTEHGDLTDHVVINVPTPTRHVTVAWKEDFTSTETVYGGPGETNSVIVKVPKVIVKNVKTWTGASILESTEHGDLTDHVVINVPTPTRHVTVAWKEDFTSTETVYGGPGETNSVIVKVPKVIVKNVKTWTGASILESTEHGDLTDHVVINVPTPTRHVTVAWKEDFTSTETVYGGPGETNSVIVKVPSVIVNRNNRTVDTEPISILQDVPLKEGLLIDGWRSLENTDSSNAIIPPSTDNDFGVGSETVVHEKNFSKMMIRVYQNRSKSEYSSEGIDDNEFGPKMSFLSRKKENLYDGKLVRKIESCLARSDFDERPSVAKNISHPEYHMQFMLGGNLDVSEALFASTDGRDSDIKTLGHLSRSIWHLENKNNKHEYNMLKNESLSFGAYTPKHIPEQTETVAVNEEDVMKILDISYQQALPERSNKTLPSKVTSRDFFSGSSFLSHHKVTARTVSRSTEHIEFAKSRLEVAAVLKSSLCDNRECQISTRTRTCFKCEYENEAVFQPFPNDLQSFGSAPRKPNLPNYRNDASENGTVCPIDLLFEPTKSAIITALEGRGSSLSFIFLILTVPGLVLIL